MSQNIKQPLDGVVLTYKALSPVDRPKRLAIWNADNHGAVIVIIVALTEVDVKGWYNERANGGNLY